MFWLFTYLLVGLAFAFDIIRSVEDKKSTREEKILIGAIFTISWPLVIIGMFIKIPPKKK